MSLGVLTGCLMTTAASASVPSGAASQQELRAVDAKLAASRLEVERLGARLDGQQEARDRLSDSFNRDASLFTYVSGALVALLALGGVLATFLAYRGIRKYAEERVEARIEGILATRLAPVEDQMKTQFEELRSSYDAKFAELYERTAGAFQGPSA